MDMPPLNRTTSDPLVRQACQTTGLFVARIVTRAVASRPFSQAEGAKRFTPAALAARSRLVSYSTACGHRILTTERTVWTSWRAAVRDGTEA